MGYKIEKSIYYLMYFIEHYVNACRFVRKYVRWLDSITLDLIEAANMPLTFVP